MNNKVKIVVVDLDNTLLRVDSFNLLSSVQFKKYIIRIGLLKILRKFRLLTLAGYKKYFEKYVYNILPEEDKIIFIDSLSNYIDKALFNKINSKYKNECRIFIISASLNQYVKPFSNKLGWEGFGSYMDGLTKQYVHLHGEEKLKFVLKCFPISDYIYVYAISDSKSDLPLLKIFDHYDLIPSN